MAASRLDLAILKEIVRIVQEKARVPEKVRILKRQFALTYLEDHRQRMEEALRRFDTDRVNMLFGQLASKVKYQVIRGVSRRPTSVPKRPAGHKRTPGVVVAAKSTPTPKRTPSPKRAATPKPARPSSRKRAATAKRTARSQPSKRPKRGTAQPKRATRSHGAAARKLKAKKRTRSS